MEISLTRAGSFHADKMVPNGHKCAAMHTKIYRYEVSIQATAVRLTPEGYVINNERVQGYFDERWGQLAPQPWDAISCENLALTSAREIGTELVAQGIEVICVNCMIEGSNGARITAKWVPASLSVTKREAPEETQSRPVFGFNE
jgi:hypothetical protein